MSLKTNLPEKKPVKIQYHYDDGSIYETYSDNDAKNYNENIESTAIMAMRGWKFLPVDWKKKNKQDE